jgi:nicotinate-nucleotide pyrophosphorylase (carboxylating)
MSISASLPRVVVESIVRTALLEDLAAGDLTTDACIDAAKMTSARFMARADLVVCGLPVMECVWNLIDPSIEIGSSRNEGDLVKQGGLIWTVKGKARSILTGERVALNFVQRMSGVATITRRYVDALPSGSKTRITDTRKTTPGLRALERYAVRVGGGKNHRDNLGSAVLIKDNHIAACGGVRAAIERARLHAPHTCRVECEVDTLEQLDEALLAGADIVLLDNMDTTTVTTAVKRMRAKGSALAEASGGITLARISELANAGVDAISIGALTHSAAAVDIGLDFDA